MNQGIRTSVYPVKDVDDINKNLHSLLAHN
jgi:hypothetical protein